MSGPRWRFREKQRNEVHQEPANTEFFAQQDVAQRLVREAGQNTIDATREGYVKQSSVAYVTQLAHNSLPVRPHRPIKPASPGITVNWVELIT